MFSRNSVGEGVGSGIAAGLRGEPSRFLWKGLRVWNREMGDAIAEDVRSVDERVERHTKRKPLAGIGLGCRIIEVVVVIGATVDAGDLAQCDGTIWQQGGERDRAGFP